MATILDCTGASYPQRIGDREILPHEGYSLRPTFADLPHSREILAWEHEGNAGIRRGPWKLVREYIRSWHASLSQGRQLGLQDWELYHIDSDRSELHDLASRHPEIVAELAALWQLWAQRCNVRPWDEILAIRQARLAQGDN